MIVTAMNESMRYMDKIQLPQNEGRIRMFYIYQAKAQDVKELTSDLFVTECGKSFIEGRDYFFIRENGRNDYHLIYLIKNHGTFVTSRGQVTLYPGELIVLPPHKKHGYHISEKDAAVYYWIHFDGTKAAEYLHEMGLTLETVYSIGLSARLPRLFDSINEELATQMPHYTEICAGLLRQIIAIIGQKTSFSAQTSSIQSAIRAIGCDFRENIPLEEYARNCGYSKYHFIRLFKEATGQTPIVYRNSLRVENACALMEQTSYTLQEISDALGFSDPAYFSKMFKRHTGMSPKRYRKEHTQIIHAD